MTVSNEKIIEITKRVVKKSFFNYFLCNEPANTKHILLAQLFPKESAIRSTVGGLETSLGTTLWEKLAIEIALENNFEIIDSKKSIKKPNVLPQNIQNLFTNYIEKRTKENTNIPISEYVKDLQMEINQLEIDQIPNEYNKLTKGSGVDLYLTKDGFDYAFDIKTVQINAGSGVKFNNTLMEWITYKAIEQKFLNKPFAFHAHIVIPYDPHTKSNWWSKFRDRAYPLDHNDLMLEDEFWNFISGKKETFKFINAAFQELVDEDFQSIFQNCLYETSTLNSINILNKLTHSTCLYDKSNPPKKYAEKILFQCNYCAAKFKQSITWFKTDRFCKNCEKKIQIF